MQYCVFSLYGPMASWGEIAVGENRHSADHPSKSAVIGLLGAALGLRRDEEEAHARLSGSLGVACLVRDPGAAVTDYHTVQTPPASAVKSARYFRTRKDELSVGRDVLNTIESRREYRCDTFVHVCLWAKTEDLPWSLQEIASALNRPRFVPYLGRKSCPPGLPVHARVVEAQTILDAVRAAEEAHAEILRRFRFPPHAALYWEPGGTPGIEARHTTVRRDAVESRRRWTFLNRMEHYGVVDLGSAGEA
ncbi:MAG: type I-E CRISPR-associated protein Cas5/CasD [Methanolinea sp.]|nr:type I-E CRISPR-associated protein Cas5/CasD [Methanolinea sp.]